MERYFKALDKIRELEQLVQNQAQQIVDLEQDNREKDHLLTERSVKLAMMAEAHAETRTEEEEAVAHIKQDYHRLVEFVGEIAATQSKFAKKARALLDR